MQPLEHRTLLRGETTLPAGIVLRSEPLDSRWLLVTEPTVDGLRRALEATGWHFLLLPPERQAAGYSLRASRAIQKALRSLARKAERAGLNAVELRRVRCRRLGVIARAVVAGYFRQVQPEALLTQPSTPPSAARQQPAPGPLAETRPEATHALP